MKILISGSSGFLGTIIHEHLIKNNTVFSLGRGNDSDFKFDFSKNNKNVKLPDFDTFIHCASLAHIVPKDKKQKDDFYKINVDGTLSLLNFFSSSSKIPKSFVYISSVSVYGLNKGKLVDESSPLLATDPYGLSKIKVEKLILKWCKQHNVVCCILRLPLVIGKNPKGNLFKMIKSIKNKYFFNIADGNAKKSMVLADDVARIILKAAKTPGVFNLTDRHHPSFFEFSKLISSQLKRNQPLNLSHSFAKILAFIGDIFSIFPFNTNTLIKMTNDLTFSDHKAVKEIGWKPKSVINNYIIDK
jgi:nucleoside-diphosphate-sugar epimerase